MEAVVLPQNAKKFLGNLVYSHTSIHSLDDGCLMHIFSFLSPIPDRYNTALVCNRWCFLACHPRMWLRVDSSLKDPSEQSVFADVQSAVLAARPGDTILVETGQMHFVSNIQIKKPLCLVGAGELPDDTVLVCLRGSDSAMEVMSRCKVTNLTIRAELGCCLLHRCGRLTVDRCLLQCESDPLDFLSCPIVSSAPKPLSNDNGDVGVSVSNTRIEGGVKAVVTGEALVLQRVRVVYTPTSIFFWFQVERC